MADNNNSSRLNHRSSGDIGGDVLTDTLYNVLRKVASNRMSGETSPQTIEATAPVHETRLRLGADQQPDWASRGQFFSAAAEAMRRILVDKARRRKAIRHGGGLKRIELDAVVSEKKSP